MDIWELSHDTNFQSNKKLCTGRAVILYIYIYIFYWLYENTKVIYTNKGKQNKHIYNMYQVRRVFKENLSVGP